MNNAILSKAVLHVEHTVLMTRNALNAATGCTWGARSARENMSGKGSTVLAGGGTRFSLLSAVRFSSSSVFLYKVRALSLA